MLQIIILWICAFALAELVEPPTYGPLHSAKRDVSGSLQIALIVIAVVAVVWHIVGAIADFWGW